MNVEAATIQIPNYFEAQAQYRQYRQAIKDGRATKDDVAIAKAYHALLRGRKVIDVSQAIANAGVDSEHRPHLAVARADWSIVFCRRVGDGGAGKFLFTSKSSTWGRKASGEVTITIAGVPRWINQREVGEGQAQVPSIPPQFRPKGALSDYHLLFEAEWQRIPPKDPLLLKRIGDPTSLLFVVLAAWDLTPLEQAVLRSKL